MEYASETNGMEVAIVGMAVRFPQSNTLSEYWSNIVQAKECVTFFSEQALLAEGIDQATLDNPNYVRAKPYIEGVCDFDAAFFGYSHKEAQTLDPKSRVLHEVAYHALEDAGYAQRACEQVTGVFLGASEDVEWLRRSMSQIEGDALTRFSSGIYGHKDLIAHFIAYSLNLSGPVYSLYTSCSTSLSATHVACRSLLFGECDLALAGGITIDLPQKSGYYCQQGMIHATDGHCRPFDTHASGTLFGDGAGVVVLRRLEDALAAGDRIYAVIRGSAVNNDGNQKMGFAAPGHEGQKKVIRDACNLADVSTESIGYVETHGTGTRIGDPIEFAALTEAFDTPQRHYCALGAVKANIGHTHAAAGVAGLIKTALALYKRTIPPLANYQTPNPKLDLQHSPFYIPTRALAWPELGTPPRAGVSSFGIGGTNVHMILEAAQPAARDSNKAQRVFIPLSAPSPAQLDRITQQMAALLNDADASEVAYTQQVVRPAFDCRRVVQVDGDGTQTVLAALKDSMPLAAWGRHCPDLRTEADSANARLLAHSAVYQREEAALVAMLDEHMLPPGYRSDAGLWAQAEAGSLLARGCLTIAALKTWMTLLPALNVLSGSGTGILPAAAATGVMATQDVLRMLWALDNKAQRLSIPERHPPTSGYTLAWQGRALRNEQHDDLGFWSEALLANAVPSGQRDPGINWLTLPSDAEDSLAALRTIAQLWGAGFNVNWAAWYGDHVPQRGCASAYPFEHTYYPLPARTCAAASAEPTQEQEVSRSYQTRPTLSVPFVAAQTPAMKHITGLMEQILELKPVGLDDDFFELGGHSLLVTQLTSRLERDYNVRIDLVALMETPNPRSIYAHIAAQLGGEDNLEAANQ
ncbi:TPA: beta-ketoacyl synthase N-terminal-like domain-containing protein [Serratia marcescens]|uniref:beta-ketoacyl synthase N-terminal-like domain-containing protein n=1 Tax=Serratia sp. CY47444 TaxID=3383626 RepID=UPI0038C3B7BD